MSSPMDRLRMLQSHIRYKELREYQPEFPMMHRVEREKYHGVYQAMMQPHQAAIRK